MKHPHTGRERGAGSGAGPGPRPGPGRDGGRPGGRDGTRDGSREQFRRGDAPRDRGQAQADRPRGERSGFRPRTESPEGERARQGGAGHTERLSLPSTPARHGGGGPQAGARPAGQRTRADVETPRGAVWLYGRHAVAAALGNPARRLRRLLLTEEAEAALSERLPQPWALTADRAERGRLDHLLGRDAVHQGAALLADPLPPPPLSTALQRPGPVIVLDQVSDPRNVGAILRSAAVFGAAAVVAQERNAPEESGALAKAASGALETIPLLRAVNIARTVIALKAAGCWTVGLAADAPPLSGPALAERRVALVLGAEGEGMRRLVRETCDEVAGIAMPGSNANLDSLNVSAAAAIALYELARR